MLRVNRATFSGRFTAFSCVGTREVLVGSLRHSRRVSKVRHQVLGESAGAELRSIYLAARSESRTPRSESTLQALANHWPIPTRAPRRCLASAPTFIDCTGRSSDLKGRERHSSTLASGVRCVPARMRRVTAPTGRVSEGTPEHAQSSRLVANSACSRTNWMASSDRFGR